MPNWKKVIVSGSDAALNSLNVTSEFTASGLNYPTSDGDVGQTIVTDGSGNLSFTEVEAEKLTFAVQNGESFSLLKGTPVHVTSTTNGTAIVIAASASVASKMPAHGILSQNLTAGSDGFATITGLINGVDTSAFSSGDTIYVAATGSYTNIKPQGSDNLIQNLGIVKKVNASNGSGEIFGSGRSNDVPNLPVDKIWVGTPDYTVTSSFVDLLEPSSSITIGGNHTLTNSNRSSIIGGSSNCILNSDCNTITAGQSNRIVGGSLYNNVVGGRINCISGSYSSIINGENNTIRNASCSAILAGCQQSICCVPWSFIGAGVCNEVTRSAYGAGGLNAIVAGQENLIRGGNSNTAYSTFIGAGRQNTGSYCFSSIVNGCKNSVNAHLAFIGGGAENCININAISSSIIGGFNNTTNYCNTHIIGSNLTAGKENYTFVNNLDVEGTVSASVFSGSFVGDGSGLTNISAGSVGAAGSNTEVQYNDNGVLGASSNFRYDGTTLDLTYTGTGDLLRLTSTDAGASSAPDLTFCRNSASPADNDTLGTAQFWGKSTAANKLYAAIYGRIACATSGQTKGNISFKQECNNVFIDTANFSPHGLYVLPPSFNSMTTPGIGLTVTGGVSGSTTLQIGSGHTNTGTLSSIAGGTLNSISDDCSTIAGGDTNTITGRSSFIGAGNNNTTNCSFAFIGAGRDNTADNDTGIVAGRSNTIFGSGRCSVIGGGESNTITGSSSNAADSSFIGAGTLNCINGGLESFIGSGCKNYITGDASVIAGGTLNTGSGACGFIGGGNSNFVSGIQSFVGAGIDNDICNTIGAFIGGGCTNVISGSATSCNHVISGGSNNEIVVPDANQPNASVSAIGGGYNNCITHGGSVIAGGTNHTVSAYQGVIVGGDTNTVSGCYGFIGAGRLNCVASCCSAVVNGCANCVTTNFSFIGGGQLNKLCGGQSGRCHDFIGGGCGNTVSTYYGCNVIVGGKGSSISGYYNLNFIGGGCLHTIGHGGGNTIVGGGRNCIDTSGPYSSFDAIVGGLCNCIQTDGGASSGIVGGKCNSISNSYGGGNAEYSSFIGGGCKNTISTYSSYNGGHQGYNIIVGGRSNSLRCVTGGTTCIGCSAIVGGHLNTGSNAFTFIGGGCNNTVSGCKSVVVGGDTNTICAPKSFIGGGHLNCITTGDSGSSIVGGEYNEIKTCSAHGFIGGGCCNIISGSVSACAGASAIISGHCNIITHYNTFIGGGCFNTGSGAHSFIGAGICNYIINGANIAGIVSGCCNKASSFSFIGGGRCNCVCSLDGSIGAGRGNLINNVGSGIGGGCYNNISGGCSFIGGGCYNKVCYGAGFGSIGGGYVNTSVFGQYNTIGGGRQNSTCGYANTVSGGQTNIICNHSFHSSIGGGVCNYINGDCVSTIAGGFRNCASGGRNFVGGGQLNCASGHASSIVGGKCNTTLGQGSGILGGCSNTASHTCSFIVGSNLTSTAANYTFMNNACVAGTTRTTTLVETSARKHKECILPLQDQIENIKKLEPVEFQWKQDKTKDIGFIAEEVKKVFPNLVSYEEDGEIHGVQYSKLTTVLVKALQQQQEQIEELKKEIFILKQQE
jgi:hypothetical protein